MRLLVRAAFHQLFGYLPEDQVRMLLLEQLDLLELRNAFEAHCRDSHPEVLKFFQIPSNTPFLTLPAPLPEFPLDRDAAYELAQSFIAPLKECIAFNEAVISFVGKLVDQKISELENTSS